MELAFAQGFWMLIAGLLTQYRGTVAGFFALGAIALAFVFLTAALRRRAFAGTPLSKKRP